MSDLLLLKFPILCKNILLLTEIDVGSVSEVGKNRLQKL